MFAKCLEKQGTLFPLPVRAGKIKLQKKNKKFKIFNAHCFHAHNV